jgi:hypothetical protein
MIDDNVFFKDSVMMTQKLIELRKDKWELAPYPLERHGFTHPDSWYDEYRRILELFDRTLKFEKTAENRFLQSQHVDADEARSHHVDEDAPPGLDGAGIQESKYKTRPDKAPDAVSKKG